MPELPEVEVIRRELAPLIEGKIFAKPLLEFPSTIESPAPDLFVSRLEGRKIINTGRKGKYLLIYLDQGILVVHLRMTGNLIYVPEKYEVEPEEDRFLRLTLPFNDGSSLRYCDMRRFGRLWLVERERELKEKVLKNVGPDIFEDLCCEDFLKLLENRKTARLKPLLLDQNFVAGMGNIYTDECLYRCGLHPRRQVADLNRAEAEELYRQIRQVLTEGIKYGGTTFRDYRTSSGALGDFQSRLVVYGRKGETCRCGTPIEKITVGGRATYYCPRCQESPKD
ncbi:MAG: bifunctional DNA-formamidopyrimidine glycosylase/DNA-(apurinic or apyrimidinic site) lyase [Bacillota bacterium]